MVREIIKIREITGNLKYYLSSWRMSRAFFKNQLWLQALNWLIKPLWIFAIERTVQLKLGDEWYGKYFVIFNLGLLFAVLLDAGLNNYISREISAAGRLVHKKRILSLRFILGLVYLILVFAAGFNQNLDLKLLALVAFNQVLASFSLMFRAVLQGRHRFVADSILSVLDRFVALILCSGFLYFYENQFIAENGIALFLVAQTCGYLIAMLLGLILVKRTDNAEPPTDYAASLSLENETLKNWIQKVGWFAVMAFAMSVFTRVDALMIRKYSIEGLTTYLKPISEGYYQAGIYAQSYRLLDAALIFSTLLSTQLLPMFTRKIANNENVKGILKLATAVVLSIGITASLVAIFGGNWILNFIYKSGYSNEAELEYATKIFGVLMSSFLPMALIHVYGTFVTALGQMKWLAFMAIGCMVLNIAINFVLIPKLGALGASWGCFTTQCVFALGCIFRSLQYLNRKSSGQ